MLSAIGCGVQLLVTHSAKGSEIVLRTRDKVLFSRLIAIDKLDLSGAADIAWGNEPFGEGWAQNVGDFLRLIKQRSPSPLFTGNFR